MMRDRFAATLATLLDEDPRVAAVLADLGIREQLMVGVAGGLALTGLRPFVHS